MKKKIKINFCDFWGGFSPYDNYFTNILKEEFDVEISNTPDYLFYSIFGDQHRYINNCVKIQYLGENIAPAMDYANYAMSFDYLEDSRNYRLPHYLLYPGYYELTNPKIITEDLSKRKFCNFVVSNGNCKERNDFFFKLSKYKKVDSGGRFMNNVGYVVEDKRKFQSEYKFSISFENNAYRPGYEWYITEKAFEAMCVNSIPIYRGGNKINEDFNSKSFINYHDFKSEDDMIEYIIYLDKNDDKYIEVLKEPWFINNQVPDNNKIENIKNFLYGIFEKRDN